MTLHTFQYASLICKDMIMVLHCTAVYLQIDTVEKSGDMLTVL